MSKKWLLMGLALLVALIIWGLLWHSGQPAKRSEEAVSFFDLPLALQGIWAASEMPKDLEFYKVEWSPKVDRLTNDEIVRYAKRSLKGDVTIVKLTTEGKTYVVVTYRNQFQSERLDQSLSKVFVKLNEKPPVYAIPSG